MWSVPLLILQTVTGTKKVLITRICLLFSKTFARNAPDTAKRNTDFHTTNIKKRNAVDGQLLRRG